MMQYKTKKVKTDASKTSTWQKMANQRNHERFHLKEVYNKTLTNSGITITHTAIKT